MGKGNEVESRRQIGVGPLIIRRPFNMKNITATQLPRLENNVETFDKPPTKLVKKLGSS
jgi:hypothetical protein